jgi:mono/diheme cytochrome c family protein
MNALKALLVVLAVAVAGIFGFAYAGVFNVAADEPHWPTTARFIEWTRDRSIALRARSVVPPPTLDDPSLVAMGAEHYAEMCTGCHLAPGMPESEIRAGLNPKPPNLAKLETDLTPGQVFWIIKHGVKMTGMPAWGATHDDRKIWGMVAFLQKLPHLSPAEYEALTGERGDAGHAHEGEDHDTHPGDDDHPPG